MFGIIKLYKKTKAILTQKNKTKFLRINKNDLLKNSKIKIEIVEDKIDIYHSIARTMANKFIENNLKGNTTSFILPVGPKGQYKRFVKICNSENINCKKLITINMDEYLDENENWISEDHPLSFRSFMKKNLFDQLNRDLKIKPENIYFPNPSNIKEIKNLIIDIDGADICFGCVGINGHIAFNEPVNKGLIAKKDFMQLETRVLDVARDTIIINSLAYGGNIEIIPRKCITIGMFEIFKSKELKFYLEHNWQSAVLKNYLFRTYTVFSSNFFKRT